MEKNVVIVHGGFKEAFKENIKKYKLFNLIQGIILLIIGISGLFFNSKIFLRLAVYVLPLLLLSYTAKMIIMALAIRKDDSKSFWIMICQSILLFISAIYVIFFPFNTLNYLVTGIGVLLVLDSVVKFIYTSGSVYPITSTILGLLCLVFPNEIINIFHKLALAIILIIGLLKISAATFAARIDNVVFKDEKKNKKKKQETTIDKDEENIIEAEIEE